MCKNIHYSLLTIALLVVTGICVTANAETWPVLPKTGFIAGRLATKHDVLSGDAAFEFERLNTESRELIYIDIPQYAVRFSKVGPEASFPVIIIQAETLGDTEIVGYRRISDGQIGSGLLVEFQLLGIIKPE